MQSKKYIQELIPINLFKPKKKRKKKRNILGDKPAYSEVVCSMHYAYRNGLTQWLHGACISQWKKNRASKKIYRI